MIDLIISGATHRSGSTLLQRIFNARKKTLIWGEHVGCLTDFCKTYDKIKYFSERYKRQREIYFSSGENPNYWNPNMTPDVSYVESAMINCVKTFFDSLYAQYSENHDIIGFKEVRYGEQELTLFRRCYPNAKIILLIRNPIDVWNSLSSKKWNKYSLDDAIDKWNRNVSFYLDFGQSDSNTYLIQYEHLVEKDSRTFELISQLGQLSQEEINSVLSVKINVSKTIIREEDKTLIVKSCRKFMKQLGYLQSE